MHQGIPRIRYCFISEGDRLLESNSRVIAIRRLLTDKRMNDMGVLLIAGYAPIGVATEPE